MKEYNEDDPDNPAKGLVVGMLMGVVAWAIVYGIYRLVTL